MGIREVFVWLAVIFGFALVMIIEILSLFGMITFVPLLLFWTLFLLTAGIFLFKKICFFGNIRINIETPALALLDKVLLSLIAITISITFMVAFIAPPNNYDSMTYHMARVAHWEQNQSVAHYQTGILRQLSFPPMAEYAILNLQVLTGNDYFANLVQWLSMLGSIIVVTLVAKLLGATVQQQIFSAFFAASIPMGILQATTTQNDYVMTFWLLCIVFFVIKADAEGLLLNIFGASIALGLAILTKFQACFFAFPFSIWLFCICVKKEKLNFWKPLLVIGLIVVLIISGHCIRNFQLFHSFDGPNLGAPSEYFSLRNISSNVAKCLFTNFETPITPINDLLYKILVKYNDILGVNIDDPRTSGFGEFKIGPYAPHEDWLGNPIHALLIFMGICFFVFKRKASQQPKLLAYLISLVVSFLVIFVFLKYSIGFRRYILTIFVLFSPFVGIMLYRVISKKALIIIIFITFIVSTPPLLMNINRPVIPPPLARRSTFSILNTPRQFFYFGGGRQEEHESYKKIVKVITTRKYDNIGVIGINDEYPLWALLKESGIKFRLEHLAVNNVSGSIPMSFNPSCVVVFGDKPFVESKYKAKYPYREKIGRNLFEENINLYGE